MLRVVLGLAVFAVVIAVGWALVRFDGVPAGSDSVLTRTCFYAATPALLVTTIAQADLGQVLSRETLAGLLAEAGGVLTAWLVHRHVLHRGVAESVIGALAAGYVNAANLGIPVLIVVLGSATAIAPILLLQLLILSPLAFALLDWSTASGTGSRLHVWTAPLRNPLLLGVLVGLVANLAGWHLKTWLGGLVQNSLDTLGALAVTVMMLSLGMSLAAASPRVRRRIVVAEAPRIPGHPDRQTSAVAPATPAAPPAAAAPPVEPASAEPAAPATPTSQDRSELGPALWVSVGWKLVLVPLGALLIGLALGLRGHGLLVPVTTASLPCAQNVFMYATRYETAKPLARDSVLLTTAGFVPVVLLASALLG